MYFRRQKLLRDMALKLLQYYLHSEIGQLCMVKSSEFDGYMRCSECICVFVCSCSSGKCKLWLEKMMTEIEAIVPWWSCRLKRRRCTFRRNRRHWLLLDGQRELDVDWCPEQNITEIQVGSNNYRNIYKIISLLGDDRWSLSGTIYTFFCDKNLMNILFFLSTQALRSKWSPSLNFNEKNQKKRAPRGPHLLKVGAKWDRLLFNKQDTASTQTNMFGLKFN